MPEHKIMECGLSHSCPPAGLQAHKPVLYIGGGCLGSSEEVQELVRRTGIPVAQTLMGLGAFPESHPLALQVHPAVGFALLSKLHKPVSDASGRVCHWCACLCACGRPVSRG